MSGPFEIELDHVQLAEPEPLAGRGGIWVSLGHRQLRIGVEAVSVSTLDARADRLRAAGFGVRWDDALSNVRRLYTDDLVGADDLVGNRVELLERG